jgi:TetR/AcrR family transcriptional repressor of nem operon
MRYSQTHKDETRTKILKSAGRALRAKGPDGVAVADVMKEVGLTHGGFYAHFPSKDALLAEAMRGVFAFSTARYAQMTDGLPPRHALATFIDFYVSANHRDRVANGCPITALNSDMPRQSKKLRAAFDDGVNSLVEALQGLIEAAGIEADGDPRALAASVLSAMAGAVAVSRAVSDKRLSEQMLETARQSIKARLGVDDASLSGRRTP